MEEREKIKKNLEYLEEMEREGHGDFFTQVQREVNRYRDKIGCDEWIENFVYEYLNERRDRNKYKNKSI